MKKITVCVQGADAYTDFCGTLTTGMVGVPVEFSFDSAWNGLHKTAVFRLGTTVKDRVLPETQETTVPWEVLQEEGRLEIGVEGRSFDGSLVIPTVWTRAALVAAGTKVSLEPGAEPTPTVYDQIAQLAANTVRYTSQALTAEQMAQARANIGAATVDEVLAALPVYKGEVVE